MCEYSQKIKSLEGLQALGDELDRLAPVWGISKKDLFEINLIIEEVCTNYIEHGEGGGKNCIGVSITLAGSVVLITIRDQGPRFDPTAVADPELDLPMEERREGGLGLYFVKHFADKVLYSRQDNSNVLTIEKTLKG